MKSILSFYTDNNYDLIPLHSWNKKVRGVEKGRIPVDSGWQLTPYSQTVAGYKKWGEKCYNIGFRIPDDIIVIDLDPRNYDPDQDTENDVADLFGALDIDDVLYENASVTTGRGGSHVYLKVPDHYKGKKLYSAIPSISGVDVKKKGGYVVCAGSRHPNGNLYYFNDGPLNVKEAPYELMETIVKDIKTGSNSSFGRAVLSGTQLEVFVLDKLDINDYSNNDTWLPIMMGSHHLTDGDGIDEFLEWSLRDPDYSDDRDKIIARWDSIDGDTNDDGNATVGTLIYHLEENGCDTKALKAALDFARVPELSSFDEKTDYGEISGDDHVLDATTLSTSVDTDEFYGVEKEKCDMGLALDLAREITKSSSNDQVMDFLRAVKRSDMIVQFEALNIAAEKGRHKLTQLKALLKALDASLSQDMGAMLSTLTLKDVFNNAKHLIVEPNGSLWLFNKTHWGEINKQFLGKVLRRGLTSLCSELDMTVNEANVIKNALDLTIYEASYHRPRLQTTGRPKPIVTCLNKELRLQKDGTYVVRDNSYKSLSTRCLKVNYDPNAVPELFIQTVSEIFKNFEDGPDMARHLAEIFGYMLQPFKDLSSWWLFKGPGGDGKSTLMGVLAALLGDTFSPVGSKVVTDNKNGGDNHGEMQLVGALAVVVGDLKKGVTLDDSKVKEYADNKIMTANPKGKSHFQFTYCGGLIMCTNTLPKSNDSSYGFQRRANVFPFNARFGKDTHDDTDRERNITENPKELAGVLNWALDGLARLRKRGNFDPPRSCVLATNTWINELSNLAFFKSEVLETKCLPSKKLSTLNELFSDYYLPWCTSNHIKPSHQLSYRSFKDGLLENGITVKIGGNNQYSVYGCSIKESAKNLARIDDFDEIMGEANE